MDEKEFLHLINTHQGTIFHLLKLYVPDATDKDDLKQEIILQAWKSRDKFRQESSFNTCCSFPWPIWPAYCNR